MTDSGNIDAKLPVRIHCMTTGNSLFHPIFKKYPILFELSRNYIIGLRHEGVLARDTQRPKNEKIRPCEADQLTRWLDTQSEFFQQG